MQPCSHFTRDMEPGPRAQPSSGIANPLARVEHHLRLSWWATTIRVSFIGAVLATALQKLNREKANDSFQEQIVACGRTGRVGGLDDRFCARSRTGGCG